MKLLVYCLLGSSSRLPARLPSGVGDVPVEVMGEGTLAAAFSRAEEEATGRAELVPVLQFRDVIEAFARAGTVLPVRYGAFFAREEDLRAFLREHGAKLGNLLAEVEGQVEMAILVSLPPLRDAPPPLSAGAGGAASGHSYLAARRSYYARREENLEPARLLFERSRTALGGLFTRAKFQGRAVPVPSADGSPRQVASVSFLVPRERVEEFRLRYGTLAAAVDAELALAGPRAPYSFVSLQPAPEAPPST